jgi:hypothetical protein
MVRRHHALIFDCLQQVRYPSFGRRKRGRGGRVPIFLTSLLMAMSVAIAADEWPQSIFCKLSSKVYCVSNTRYIRTKKIIDVRANIFERFEVKFCIRTKDKSFAIRLFEFVRVTSAWVPHRFCRDVQAIDIDATRLFEMRETTSAR